MGSVTAVAIRAGTAGALENAVIGIGRRFGTRALVRGASLERRSDEGVLRTGTALDRLAGGVPTGSPCAFVGTGTSGKLTLALRAVVAAQRGGAHAMWVDPTASLDALAASRAGVDLGRLLVVRARTREDALAAAAAGLRSGGFRLVAVDTGPALLGSPLRGDDVGPLVPLVRGSSVALVVVADHAPARLALPVFRFERVAWERELGRTTGWTFRVGGARGAEALFHARSYARTLLDLGVRGDLTAVPEDPGLPGDPDVADGPGARAGLGVDDLEASA